MANAPCGGLVTRATGAIVLAAGLGERMRPLTLTIPKPMVELHGRPLIDYALEHVAAAGIANVVVNLHYLGDRIRDHVAARFPHVVFSPEAELLDTGGGAVRALEHLGEGPFFAINADTVWFDGQTPVLQRMLAAWNDAEMDALLLLFPGPHEEVGDYALSSDGRARYRPDGAIADYGFRAVSLLHSRLFADAPPGRFSLKRLWDRAQTQGRLFGIVHDGRMFHLSTPQDLARANEEFGE